MKNDLLNIITPCCRPKNLLNIATAIKGKLDHPYRWIVIFDEKILRDSSSVIFANYIKRRVKSLGVNVDFYSNKSSGKVGHGHRNFILDLLSKEQGWIYFNDDDNIISSDFASLDFSQIDYDAIVLSQSNPNGTVRYNGEIALLAAPENMKTYRIDTAQLIYNLPKIKTQRFEEDYYEADGMFAEKFYSTNKNVLFLKNKFCYYNFLEV
tara:strand:- start:124 stop:750 length:627 start_codon:yes stop_codon:yes gene_type:complete